MRDQHMRMPIYVSSGIRSLDSIVNAVQDVRFLDRATAVIGLLFLS
jgi:hypothetical protein